MISVVLCTHNRSVRLRVALNALVRQQFPDEGAEVIVVNNASTDNTEEVIVDYKLRYPFLRCVQVSRKGLSHARNTGIRYARGDIVCFTDDDAIAQEGWLRAIARVMRNGAYWGGGGRIIPTWPKHLPAWFTSEGLHKMHGGGSIVSLDMGNRPKTFSGKGLFPMGANMWYRREVFLKGVFFPPERGMNGRRLVYGDDFMVARRVMREFGPLVYCPNSVVHHPVYSERLTKCYFRRAYFSLGRFYGSFDRNANAIRLFCSFVRHGIGLLKSHFGYPATVFYHELELRFLLGYVLSRVRLLHNSS